MRSLSRARSGAPGRLHARSGGVAQQSRHSLSDLGRREDALAAAQEAASLYRALAAARPDAFTPNLAMSLNNLAVMQSGLGRREDALAAAQEALALTERR